MYCRALGHSANRGKVYYLHPELFKVHALLCCVPGVNSVCVCVCVCVCMQYACDGDDKTWLYENKYLPVHGGKAFLMIHKEVTSLVAADQLYK